MFKRLFVVLLGVVPLFSCSRGASPSPITQDELVRRTQSMFDAVVPGDQTPWKRYIAADAFYFDEKGRNMDKKALLADLTPMPSGYSGTIKLAKVQSHMIGDTAIMSYDLEETETVFGQELHARYHETDTWMNRNGDWQIVAGQVLRYYEDPAPGKADSKKFSDYVGTYELVPGNQRTVSVESGKLYSQRGEHPKDELIPEASDIFFRKGVEGRILFGHGKDGKVDSLIDRRNNEDVVWKILK